MAEKKDVLFVKTGRVVAREELLSAVEEQLKIAPKEAALQFIVKPLVPEEELTKVIDQMASEVRGLCCNGCA